MKKGTIMVEQILKDGTIIKDYDTSLSTSEISDVLCQYFPQLHKCSGAQNFFIGEYKKHKYAIRCKNVTYLGNPHPTYKKRIQIADDLYYFYNAALSLNAKPILLGVYFCNDNLIFVDFKIDTYIKKKAHNSSAHIYSSDLYAATVDGYFQKIDYWGNTITAFRPDVINVFLDEFFNLNGEPSNIEGNYYEEKYVDNIFEKSSDFEYTSAKISNNSGNQYIENIHMVSETSKPEKSTKRTLSYVQLFKEYIMPEINTFFQNEEKEWFGIDCYKKMIADNYKNKYQPEWVGFFLEYEFEKYISQNKLEHKMVYYQDKTSGGIDLDLYFPPIDSFGDLKAHSEDSRGIQGNDWNTVFSIISKQEENSHIYYIVCEHSTQKDSEYEYEVTKFWNREQHKSDLMSYHKRMKHNITLKRLYILDINYENKEYLTMFKQGLNSNGKPRPPKIMIEHDNLSHFILEEIKL